MTRLCLPLPLLLMALLMAGGTARAQDAGGYAASFLRRELMAREIAMAGVFTPFAAGGSALFSNSSALARLERPIAAVTYSYLPSGQELYAAGYGHGIGRFAGVSVGMTGYGVGNVRSYSADEKPLGTIGSRDLAFSLGGGLAIGPGNVGATIRYLRSGPTGIDGGYSGYTLDLSGSLDIDERFFFSLAMNNVAGEMKGPREIAPWNTRIGGAYLYSLDERNDTMRIDPSGTPMTRHLAPRAYILGVVEARTAAYSDAPRWSFAGEWVPLIQLSLGVRAGFSTQGDVSAGFFYNLPVDFTRDLRFDVATRRDFEYGELSYHATLTAGF
ncbi:MAG: hypothetical protein JWQ98_273 [Chlorobi bacterium]|nr:hypothetical protein [Chlorobiota bacterium]